MVEWLEILGYGAVGRVFESRLESASNKKILSVSLAVNILVLYFFSLNGTEE